jgi:small subunit ribosomal protein S13
MADEEEKQDKKQEQPHKEREQNQKSQSKHEQKNVQKQQKAVSIIRLGGADIDGDLSIERSLAEIKGVGINLSHSLAYVIENKLGIAKSTKLGALGEEQIESVESVIKDPIKYGIPVYLLNRRKDMESGKDMHLIGNDLTFSVRQDVNRDVALRVWRGYRHQHGQKVRGQRTKSTGRTGATVGVMKKSAKQQMAAAAQEKGKPASSQSGTPAAKK